MKFNFLAFAIPLFICIMSFEYLMARNKRLPYFHLHDSIANISIGIAERLLDVFTAGLFYFVYHYLQHRYGLLRIHPSVLLWVALLIATDFLWYWYHRFAHEINILWAVHVVHHQSEDFNFTVSARITVLQAFVRMLFWCVLPVIGFPAEMISVVLLVHGVYPFFIHTRMIGKLGVLEYVLVTPSHHRVHHACNEQYLDKNYGDVFIIWDKLFGTFMEEGGVDKIRYGLTKPLNSYSFMWQHFHFFAELYFEAKLQKGLRKKLAVFFGRPSLLGYQARERASVRLLIRRQDIPMCEPLNRYVIWQIGVAVLGLFLFILLGSNMPLTYEISISCLVLVTLVNCGAIMEKKKWIIYLEVCRLLISALCLVTLAPNLWLLLFMLLLVCIGYYYFQSLQSYYLKLVYPSTAY